MEVFGQYEFNEFLLLDRRLIAGIGPRIRLLSGEHGAVVFGTAAMVEEERLNGGWSLHPRMSSASMHAQAAT